MREGGVIVQHVHEVEIACPAAAIPEKLAVNINHLALNESILLNGLKLPEGAKFLVDDLEEVVVECVIPQEQPEEAGEGEPSEPEVIGAKDKEEESED